ncbi:RMND5A protein [Histoplasma capsulatum]|uniref:RMND5A protein n=1 Tax=Ajellomyces capsulatus TaxID=5037 RepID=A0A8A1M6A5_AJECA|nr:RMND5A protein [Histoplasma capsulatum]
MCRPQLTCSKKQETPLPRIPVQRPSLWQSYKILSSLPSMQPTRISKTPIAVLTNIPRLWTSSLKTSLFPMTLFQHNPHW